jgi:hypothetical protein
MANDFPRALLTWIGEIMNSGIVRSISESTFATFVKNRRPYLHPFVVENFPRVWDYITQRLRQLPRLPAPNSAKLTQALYG